MPDQHAIVIITRAYRRMREIAASLWRRMSGG